METNEVSKYARISKDKKKTQAKSKLNDYAALARQNGVSYGRYMGAKMRIDEAQAKYENALLHHNKMAAIFRGSSSEERAELAASVERAQAKLRQTEAALKAAEAAMQEMLERNETKEAEKPEEDKPLFVSSGYKGKTQTANIVLSQSDEEWLSRRQNIGIHRPVNIPAAAPATKPVQKTSNADRVRAYAVKLIKERREKLEKEQQKRLAVAQKADHTSVPQPEDNKTITTEEAERKARRREAQRKYYATHKEKRREYYQKHKAEIMLSQKICREKNREKLRERSSEYRKAHREEARQWQREYYRTHRNEVLERQKKWREENREKYRDCQRKSAKKYYQRKKEAKVNGELCKEDIASATGQNVTA